MVALNTAYAPSKTRTQPKNRVGNFFGGVADCAGENRSATRKGTGENRLTVTIIASGRPFWPSRDPIGEYGGLNLYAFVGNDGVNWVDYLGYCSVEFDLTFDEDTKWGDYINASYEVSDCPCCEKTLLIQTVDRDSFHPGLSTSPHVDRDEGKEVSGDPGFPYYNVQSPAYPNNPHEPARKGSYSDDAGTNWTSLGIPVTWKFELCVTCVEGEDEGKTIGCITFEVTDSLLGGMKGSPEGKMPGQPPSDTYKKIVPKEYCRPGKPCS